MAKDLPGREPQPRKWYYVEIYNRGPGINENLRLRFRIYDASGVLKEVDNEFGGDMLNLPYAVNIPRTDLVVVFRGVPLEEVYTKKVHISRHGKWLHIESGDHFKATYNFYNKPLWSDLWTDLADVLGLMNLDMTGWQEGNPFGQIVTFVSEPEEKGVVVSYNKEKRRFQVRKSDNTIMDCFPSELIIVGHENE